MGKGGGGSGGGASSGTQETIQREAPGVESRKLALYDEAVKLAQQPVSIPAYQVAGPTGLEQTGFQQAATTGVGQQAVGQGITSLQAGLGSAFGAPNVSQFFNPYQSYVTDEINRQAQIGQNQLAAQAVQAGAFGGGREGVQRAELDRARLETIGQSQAQGFQTALGAAQNQQQLQAQTGLQAGQALGQFGAQQQAMQQGDIQSLLQAGGVQRALGQQALEAQRATSLAQQYEPYQRVEFLKNVMTNLPTGQSSITATTAPGSNPLAQAAGAGLGAYTAYSLLKPRMKEGGLVSVKKFQEGGAVAAPKKQEGAFTDEQKFALLSAPVIGALLQGKTAPGQTNLEALFGSVGKGVSEIPETAIAIKKLDIANKPKDEEKKTALLPLTPELINQLPKGFSEAINVRDRGFIEVSQVGNQLVPVKAPVITSKAEDRDAAISKAAKDTGVLSSFIALDSTEKKIDEIYRKTGNIPGFGGGAFLPDFLAGKEGKDVRNNIATLTNITLKDRSGATVTDQEFERAKKELATSLGKTDRDLMVALDNYRDRLNSLSGVALSGFDQRDLQDFFKSGGAPLEQREGPFKKYIYGKKEDKKTEAQPFTYKVKKSGDKNIIKIETE